ncbi:MAG: zinc ribbon domain-containing protein [Thermoproteota archaeon]
MDMRINECPNCGAKVENGTLYCSNYNYVFYMKGSSEDLLSTIHSLEQENLELRSQLWKLRRKPSRSVGAALSILGFTALFMSIMYESSILAFIGLGLTFWGILLLFIRPMNYVRSEFMKAMTKAYYDLMQRLLSHLGYDGDPIYLPPRRLRALRTGGYLHWDWQLTRELRIDTFRRDPRGSTIYT